MTLKLVFRFGHGHGNAPKMKETLLSMNRTGKYSLNPKDAVKS